MAKIKNYSDTADLLVLDKDGKRKLLAPGEEAEVFEKPRAKELNAKLHLKDEKTKKKDKEAE